MSLYLSFLSGVALGLVGAAIVCAIARFILSSWLEGRALAIAAIACSVTYGLAQFSYRGPIGGDALQAFGGLTGTAVALMMIGNIWLRRIARREGE